MLIKDLKLNVLKKIDPDISSTNRDRKTEAYLNAFTGALNRGLQDLATSGKYIIKDFKITQQEVINLLPGGIHNMDVVSHYSTPIAYEANAAAYYFEVDSTAEIVFFIDGAEVLKINHAEKQGFKPYKGFIANPDKVTVRMEFGGSFPYNIRNAAMYGQEFESEADIWEYVSEKRYNLKQLTPDFYKLSQRDVVFQSGISGTRYEKTDSYYFEGDSTLVLNGLQRGEWKVHYYAYPPEIAEGEADDFNVELDPEVMQLLIVFVASELVWDDDRSASGMWRNHYEAGKAALMPTEEHSKAEFIDVQGW